MSEQSIKRRDDSTVVLPLDSARDLGMRASAGRAHRIPKIRGRAEEIAAMRTWRRWQDWFVAGLGAVLFLTPSIVGEPASSVAASTAYVLGALIALTGVLNAAMRNAVAWLELIAALLAVIVFVSPWVFGFIAVTGLAWAAWIVAILVVLTVGSLFAPSKRPSMA